ncbi:uncharacterized protein MJAP1_003401 [Malassezia japonica]|uniref:Small EDRK-rich factor-like N-terminal domain-containing protein n=1 Tax=Malassezia japonica TaxID=223818 RepID=A0AAF0F405_9BASI|nr:uncharacterized protein MJAP1_003401 [Malassezia japonica]WFD40415.1 hypothetical protein MJAP1_003401 [Malassezia japonica]
MTRGNARELARAKNQKKQADQNKGKNASGMSLAQRREADANALRAKQEAAAAKKAAAGQGGS